MLRIADAIDAMFTMVDSELVSYAVVDKINDPEVWEVTGPPELRRLYYDDLCVATLAMQASHALNLYMDIYFSPLYIKDYDKIALQFAVERYKILFNMLRYKLKHAAHVVFDMDGILCTFLSAFSPIRWGQITYEKLSINMLGKMVRFPMSMFADLEVLPDKNFLVRTDALQKVGECCLTFHDMIVK